MNWSNPPLRWGHTSQPITTRLKIRHHSQSQSPNLSHPLPLLFFFFNHDFMSNHQPPDAEVVTVCWCSPVWHSFFSLLSLKLACHRIVCSPFIHKIHNRPHPSWSSSWLSVGAAWTEDRFNVEEILAPRRGHGTHMVAETLVEVKFEVGALSPYITRCISRDTAVHLFELNTNSHRIA